jgi:uncharacterized protein (DUF2235 family)
MIRLAVFCDGTWNGLQMQNLTNVARLARSVVRDPPDGVPQLVYYDEGVGTATGVSRTSDRLEAILGGAFGAGLDRKIEQAYRFIVLNYKEPDDEIFIFGFSRGAYTARSLCGLIRKCGILRPEHLQRVPEAMQLYRNRKIHPAGPECQEFRDRYSRREVVGSEDLRRKVGETTVSRRAAGAPDDGEECLLTDEVRRKRAVRIRYLGLWDTVGSLGVPDRFVLLSAFNKRFRFHDTEASKLIESLRHAIAADEDRRTFSAAPFSNIRDLNITATDEQNAGVKARNERAVKAGRAPAPLAQVVDRRAPGYISYDQRRYQQKWFPGDHGAVGGGNFELGLSSAALLWVAQGAQAAGLAFDDRPEGELAMAGDLANPLVDWRIGSKPGTLRPAWATDLLGMIGGYRSRAESIGRDEVHPGARLRWMRMAHYRPKVFSPFTGEVRLGPHRYVELVTGPPFRLLFVLALIAGALLLLWLLGVVAHELLRLLPFGIGGPAADVLAGAGAWVRGLFGR